MVISWAVSSKYFSHIIFSSVIFFIVGYTTTLIISAIIVTVLAVVNLSDIFVHYGEHTKWFAYWRYLEILNENYLGGFEYQLCQQKHLQILNHSTVLPESLWASWESV